MAATTFQQLTIPERSGEYKVAQLSVRDQTCLCFGAEWNSHGAILMHALHAAGIGYRTIQGKSGYPVPALEGSLYKVYGLGMAQVDIAHKQAAFYGSSFDYGIGIDPEHLKSIQLLVPEWLLQHRETEDVPTDGLF